MIKISKEKYILFGMIIGSTFGMASGFLWGEAMVDLVGWMGTIFLNSLKMLIMPLIIFSMVTGICSLGNIKNIGWFGVKTIIYYMVTTSLAVLLGLILVNIIQPGSSSMLHSTIQLPEHIRNSQGNSLSQIITGFISPNIMASIVNMDILPVIMFSLFLGGVLSTMEDKAQPVIVFFQIMNDAVLKMVNIILWFSPFGIFGLIAAKIGAVGPEHFIAELNALFKYFITVVSGLFFHGIIVLPLFYLLFTKKNPLIYLKNSLTALITAFSTASSSATLPVTIECTEEKNHISTETAGFVLPLGATINMDGTALYEAVAAMFIAQSYGIDLTLSQQVIIFFTASLAAIGAAGIPEAGLVTMVMVLNSVGLPVEGIGMILAIDWFLDRFRTTVNVWGDMIGAGILDKKQGPVC